MLSLFSSIPGWGWWDILFTLLVLAGICGETDWLPKLLIRAKANDLLPPDSKRKNFKHVAEAAVIVGIAGEIICLAVSLRADAALNKEAEGFKARAAELEMKMQPRIIDLESGKDFIKLNKGWTKFPLKIVVGVSDNETENFAIDVSDFFKSAGFPVDEKIYHILGASVRAVSPSWSDHSVSRMIALYCSTNNEPHGTIQFDVGTMDFRNDAAEPYNDFFQTVNQMNAAGFGVSIMDAKSLTLDGNIPLLKPGEFGLFIPQKIY